MEKDGLPATLVWKMGTVYLPIHFGDGTVYLPIGLGKTFAKVFPKVAVRSRKAESRAKVAVWGLGLRRSVGGRGLTGKVLRSRTARLTD